MQQIDQSMSQVGERIKVNRIRVKGRYDYPALRLPLKYGYLIGTVAQICEGSDGTVTLKLSPGQNHTAEGRNPSKPIARVRIPVDAWGSWSSRL